MSTLTTLDNVKGWLGINGAENDDLLNRMIENISTFVEKYLGRNLLSASQVEKRSGPGSSFLLLKDSPVTAVASVIVDGISIPAASSSVVPGYTFDETCIYLNSYTFTRGRNNVHLVYTAGYAELPSDIEQVIIETIGMRFKEKERIGHQSKTIGGETVAFVLTDFSKSGKSVLDLYKRVAPI